MTVDQTQKYDAFYGGLQQLRWLFRFDVRYRCRRLREIVQEHRLNVSNASVLEVGFGTGRLLAAFPTAGPIAGSEISRSAVEAAQKSDIFSDRDATFYCTREGALDQLPSGPFDAIISSHVLEHVADDREMIASLWERLSPGGLLFAFVPVEEPGYNPDHVREYTVETLSELLQQQGFEIVHEEGSMNINGHVWKWLTIPSRRRWPVLKTLVDVFRLGTLSLIPYPLIRRLDRALNQIGAGPRQAFALARKPRRG